MRYSIVGSSRGSRRVFAQKAKPSRLSINHQLIQRGGGYL